MVLYVLSPLRINKLKGIHSVPFLLFKSTFSQMVIFMYMKFLEHDLWLPLA